MQVSVETLNALERRVTVRVPAEKVATEIQSRLQTLSRKVKVHGFRPGKVPPKIMKQLYGPQAWLETVGELMENSLREALTQENLNPLSQPNIQPKPLEEGQDFEYSATFEVAPQVEPTGFETIQVVRPVAEVTEQDVDDLIESLRWQQAVWNAVERPASQKDRVRLDFTGKIDGQEFLGSKGENAEFILDGKTLFRDFEERLLGLSSGAEAEFDYTLPDSYPNKDLAGKTARFQIKLNVVEEATLPEVDDAFAEKFDIREGGVPALRQSLLDNMQRNLHESIKTIIKRQVTQGLFQANRVPLSRALVAVEIENLASQLQFPEELSDEQKWQLKAKMFGTQAYQRVALGLLMSELVKRENIQVDEQRVRGVLETLAAAYQDPEEVIRAYEQNPQMMDNARALALEDQIVDWLLERAQVTEKASTFAEIMNPRRPVIPGVQELSEPDEQDSAVLTDLTAQTDPEPATHE
jgi:trigger factor